MGPHDCGDYPCTWRICLQVFRNIRSHLLDVLCLFFCMLLMLLIPALHSIYMHAGCIVQYPVDSHR